MADVTTYSNVAGEEARSDTSGWLTEALGGAAVVVLAILGLMRIDASLLAAIATIVLGAAFLVEGGALAARFMRVARRETTTAHGLVGGDVAMESMCGAAGIVLGILAIVGIYPMVLVPAAVIVFGAGMLSASGTAWRPNAHYTPNTPPSTPVRPHWFEESFDFSGSQVLIGFAGIVLGILALAGYVPLVLSLVALLALGFGILLGGSWMASRLTSLFAT
jgi:hypothetical protein